MKNISEKELKDKKLELLKEDFKRFEVDYLDIEKKIKNKERIRKVESMWILKRFELIKKTAIEFGYQPHNT